MSHMSYRRLKQDLYWGYRLSILRAKHLECGFRGNAKGKGFHAYLKAAGIPARKAYRLIARYHRIEAIWDSVHVANAALFDEVISIPPGALERLPAICEAICDNVADTNESTSRAGQYHAAPNRSLEECEFAIATAMARLGEQQQNL